MKKIIIIFLTLTAFSCKAQSLIKPLDGGGSCPMYDTNCYEKDTTNEINKYSGTWKYQSGNTEIIFKLKKEEHYQLSSNTNFSDLLVGEYQYIENGLEIANTLAQFDNPFVSGYSHKIRGGIFMHRLPSYYCEDNSEPAEIKVKVNIGHPTDTDVDGQLILRYVNDSGIEKLEVCVYDQTTLGDGDVRTLIPDGQYVFVKQ